MDGHTQISPPPFPPDPSRSYAPLRPDHSGSQDTPGNDGYESNRSPTGSGIMNESGSTKRRKVNHGMFCDIEQVLLTFP